MSAKLPDNPKLADFQTYIKEIGRERGWDKNNYLEIFLLFGEEVGELAKAMRNRAGLYAEEAKQNDIYELESEFADVFNYLLDLANVFDIDLETAFRKKDAENALRVWKSNSKKSDI